MNAEKELQRAVAAPLHAVFFAGSKHLAKKDLTAEYAEYAENLFHPAALSAYSAYSAVPRCGFLLRPVRAVVQEPNLLTGSAGFAWSATTTPLGLRCDLRGIPG